MDELMELLRGAAARQYRRIFSRVGWALTALVVLQVAAQYVLLMLTALTAPGLLHNELFYYALVALCTYGIGFPAALLILRTLPAHPPARPETGLSAGQWAGVWLMALGWLYLSNVVTLVLMRALETFRGAPISNPIDVLASQPLLVNLLLSCVLAPVAEELCFRRGIIDRLRPCGGGFAVCASALLFALSHGNLYQMLYAFTVGVIFGALYLYTGRIRHTMFLHAGLNFVSAGLMPLLSLLGQRGDWILSLLILAAMSWAIQWTVARRKELAEWCGSTGWGSGEVWGHLAVNPGMTVFVLSIIATVWLISFQ